LTADSQVSLSFVGQISQQASDDESKKLAEFCTTEVSEYAL
jgi:hypothetical protein